MTQARRLLSFALVAAFALGGCAGARSGGAGSGLLPSQSDGASSQAKRRHTTTKLSIRIPKRVRVGGRHPRFVSPSTLSATIGFAPASGCVKCSPAFTQNIGLTAASPNCAAGSSGTLCSFTYNLQPGTYTGSMTTYDGPLDGTGKPTGNVLSEDQGFPLNVVAGKANTPTIALYGVPVNLFCQAVSATTILVALTLCTQSFFVVAPTVTSSFLVYAEDADGNLMLGPGAPTFAASGSGFTFTTKGNTILVTPPAFTSSLLTFTITASSPACSATGAVCAFSEIADFDSVVAMADSATNSVQVFTHLQAFAGAGAPIATITNGISGPAALAFDKSGDLFVANTGTTQSSVTEYAPPYTGAPIATITQNLSLPYAIAIGPTHQELAVLNGGTPTMEVFEGPPYTSVPHGPAAFYSDATSFAFDSSDNIWVSFFSENAVARYPIAGLWGGPDTLLTSGAPSNIGHPAAVILDANNNLDVAEGNTGKIDQFGAPSYGGAPVYTSSAITGISALAITPNHTFMAACGNGEVDFLKSYNLSFLNGFTYAGTCMPAFDRQNDLELGYASPARIIELTYQSGLSIWAESKPFTSVYIQAPAAIATWP